MELYNFFDHIEPDTHARYLQRLNIWCPIKPMKELGDCRVWYPDALITYQQPCVVVLLLNATP